MTATPPHTGTDSVSFATPPRASFWQMLGPGGLASLMLASLSTVLTLGWPLFHHRRRVLIAAMGETLRPSEAILVLGRKLAGNEPTDVFTARLEHGLALWRQGWAPRIIVAGGLTGDAMRSEAEAGRDWLLARGLPDEALSLEDRSQHTLENFFNVRRDFPALQESTLILVSDPLHMARSSALARGLGLNVIGSPALTCPPPPGSPAWKKRCLREAFLLHWYHTGLTYSRIIGSKRQLDRVT